ncbi:hypothetical protein Q8A67_007911 [Cirrhinus molitorella]|uniref:Uncharacterized protein n=1 Tax=Cirrhinus molitorella TaxID=172907 RepID=A0AA88Q0P3_9TELE|nr:hypothetical protein Q8A67_007911 [Cirrhinus molitorella]
MGTKNMEDELIKELSARVETWRAAHALFSSTLINPAIPPIPTAPPFRSSGMSFGTPDTPSLLAIGTSRMEAGCVMAPWKQTEPQMTPGRGGASHLSPR